MEVKKGYKQTEVGIIPDDWKVITYGDAFNFLTTATYSRAELTETNKVHYIHYGDIHTRWNYFLDVKENSLPTVRDEQVKNYPLLKEGDLIMADASEDYSGIGKSVEVKNLGKTKVISGLHTFLLRDKNEIFVNGFRGYIHSNGFVKYQFDKLATGLKVYGVSRSNLKSIFIPLPTKSEQTAIATALTDADALISSLEKLIDKKRKIKQGAMQKLLEPKKIWLVKKLGEECEIITKGRTPTSYGREYKKSGINFIKIETLQKNGDIVKEKVAFIDSFTHDLFKSSQLRSKDILFSIAGALGRVAIVSDEILPANTNQALGIIRLKKVQTLNAKYVYYFLNSEKIQRHINSISVQGAQANLSLLNIYDLPIAFPDYFEQTAIAATLTDIDAEISALETKLVKYKNIKQGMMQNLLTGKIRLV